MLRFGAVPAVVVALFAATAFAQPSASKVTATKLTTSFRQSTGDRLLLNKKMSYAGHYRAYDVGVRDDREEGEVRNLHRLPREGHGRRGGVPDLLADSHTGVLGTPGPGKIYWESGSTVYGDQYWLAKRRYGENVVLWWYGSTSVKKTDRTFKRLHAALAKAVS